MIRFGDLWMLEPRCARIVILLSLVSALLLSILSCGDTSTKGTVNVKYVINGVLSSDAQQNTVYASANMTRNSLPFTTAIVSIAAPPGDSADPLYLVGDGSGTFTKQFSPNLLHNTSFLKVEEIGSLVPFSFSLSVPDTFSFATSGLANDQVRSSQDVKLLWTHSTGEDGYFIVVKPSAAASGAVGYSRVLHPLDYSSEGQYLMAMIPNTAFRTTQGNFTTGDYGVWVVAFHDSPIAYTGLPFTLPSEFVPNINRSGGGITGQIGAMYIPTKTVITAVAGS